MADDLMLEVLKDVQQRLVTLDHDMREEFGRVNLRLAAIEENTARSNRLSQIAKNSLNIWGQPWGQLRKR